jgi:hypothetical protein
MTYITVSVLIGVLGGSKKVSRKSLTLSLGGVTGAYITTKVKEDSRFESISWSKVFEALQLLVLESIIYQVNPHEYSLIQ